MYPYYKFTSYKKNPNLDKTIWKVYKYIEICSEKQEQPVKVKLVPKLVSLLLTPLGAY